MKSEISLRDENEKTAANEYEEKYQLLISRFSHEIRNPLTLISSTLPFLEEDCPDLLESDLWKSVKQDIADVILLVRDMSAFNNSSHIRKAAFYIMSFLDNIRSSFEPVMKKHNIDLNFSSRSISETSCFYGDEAKLKEAVTNLLLNAIDAVSGLSSPKTIDVTAIRNDSGLCIHVRDNGPGIPSEYLDTLFTPFVTHKTGGTGLGLCIVRGIIRQHGGEVTVDTCTVGPDTYTDFCLQLPLL